MKSLALVQLYQEFWHFPEEGPQSISMAAMNDEGLSQFKDILTMYNHMSELCFNRCVINLNDRTLSEEEKACTDVCAEKAMKFNNRLMKVFVVEQPKATERRLAEAERDAETAAERLRQQGADPETLSAQEVAREALLGAKK